MTFEIPKFENLFRFIQYASAFNNLEALRMVYIYNDEKEEIKSLTNENYEYHPEEIFNGQILDVSVCITFMKVIVHERIILLLFIDNKRFGCQIRIRNMEII